MHRALASCQALAAHAGLVLLDQFEQLRIDLDEGLLLLFVLVSPVSPDLGERLNEKSSVERVNDGEQELALDVVLALLRRVWEVLHDLLLGLDLLQDAIDGQLGADGDADWVDLPEQEVALLARQDLLEELKRAASLLREEQRAC